MKTSRTKLLLFLLTAAWSVLASENVPHVPFAPWANLAGRGQLERGAVYQESEAYCLWDIWRGYNGTPESQAEHYGSETHKKLSITGSISMPFQLFKSETN